MEKRIAKIETDQVDMNMHVGRITNLYKDTRHIPPADLMQEDLVEIKSEIEKIKSDLNEMKRTEAMRHKEIIDLLSKHIDQNR